MIAREKGLGPLADYLYSQEPTGTPLETFAASFVNAEMGVAKRGRCARRGAPHRCRNHQRQCRYSQLLRRAMFEEGIIVSKKAMDAVDEQQKFKMYYDYASRSSRSPRIACSPSAAARPKTSSTSSSNSIHNARSNLIKSKIHKQPRGLDSPIELRAEGRLEASAQ